MRYLLYARKSSESEDKQAQSIEDQLKDLRALATQRSLNVVGELTEAKSAKAPGGRPVFAELVARIQSGEADAILCWHVNRLFRNPIDFGTVSWMLQTGALLEIQTPHQIHRSGDNVLLLSVENGMANQYILDLRKAVARGLNSKVEKGWYPHKAPEGYRNVEAIIEADRERFPLIRKAWDLMLTERYTAPQVLEIMTKEWGYTSKKLKKVGGTPLTRSTIYNIFSNIFYTGYFKRNGEIHQGSHPPMVTLEEFYKVQRFIKKDCQVRPRTHTFPYTGLIECGRCGCAVVGDYKRRRLADGSLKTYQYYYCGNPHRTCTRRVIREDQLDQQVLHLLEKIQVPEELRALGLQVIEEWKRHDVETQEQIQESQAQAIEALERKLDKLLELKLNDLLSDGEYVEQKLRLQNDLMTRRMQRQQAREQSQGTHESIDNVVALATYGAAFFEGTDVALRAVIAKTIGARYVLTDGNLAVEMSPAFAPLCELQQSVETGSQNNEKDALDRGRLTWWSTLDVIRTIALEHRIVIQALLPGLPSGSRARQAAVPPA